MAAERHSVGHGQRDGAPPIKIPPCPMQDNQSPAACEWHGSPLGFRRGEPLAKLLNVLASVSRGSGAVSAVPAAPHAKATALGGAGVSFLIRRHLLIILPAPARREVGAACTSKPNGATRPY